MLLLLRQIEVIIANTEKFIDADKTVVIVAEIKQVLLLLTQKLLLLTQNKACCC